MKVECKLKQILKDRNISQKELAQMSGIRESTISSIVRESKSVLNFEHFSKIANALNISDIRELIELKED